MRMYGLTQIALESSNHVTVKVLPKRGWSSQAEAGWYRKGMRYGFQFNPIGVVKPDTYKYVMAFNVGVAEGKRLLSQYSRKSNVTIETRYVVGDRVTVAFNLTTMVGTIEKVVDCRPDSMGSTQRVCVKWNSGSSKSYSARQLQSVNEHTIVKGARTLIERHKFSIAWGDMVGAQNHKAEIMDLGDKLTIKHTAYPSFDTVLNAIHKADHYTDEVHKWVGYSPTFRSGVDVELIALADLYDYVQELCEVPAKANRS